MARIRLRSAVPILWRGHDDQSRDRVADRFARTTGGEGKRGIGTMNPTPIAEIERRAHPRVTVALRCYNVGARTWTAIARTVNISRTGILLRLSGMAGAEESVPNLGDGLRVDVVLPASSLGQKCIRCCGRVVRVQLAEDTEPLIAVEIAQMEFREHKTAAERADGELHRSRSAGGSIRTAGG
jgi:PilZ domain